jgi:hypothetical protein
LTLYNCTVDNNSGVFISSGDVSVSKTLTFTLGKIALGSNNIIIGASGNISGADASNYIVCRRIRNAYSAGCFFG